MSSCAIPLACIGNLNAGFIRLFRHQLISTLPPSPSIASRLLKEICEKPSARVFIGYTIGNPASGSSRVSTPLSAAWPGNQRNASPLYAQVKPAPAQA